MDPKITIVSAEDDTVFRYYAIHGEGVPPEQVGWALQLTSGTDEPDVQAVSAEEVSGDLATMGEDVAWMQVLVRSGTDDMITSLRADPDSARRGTPAAVRLAELEQELAALPPEADDD